MCPIQKGEKKMAMFREYETKKGKFWELRAYLGQNDVGGEVRITRRGFKTKKAAQKELSRLQVEFDENGLQHRQSMTFQELYDLWLEQYRLSVKPSSVATARRYCELHVLPAFGKMKVDKITISYCQKVVNGWHSKYKQYGYLKKEAQKIMKFGVAIEVMKSNPMQKIITPRKKEVEQPIKFYTKEELQTFFKHLESMRTIKLETFFRVIAFTGMRKSEVLSLQWTDVDFSKKTLSIGKTLAIDEFGKIIIQEPKTTNSLRTIKLDDTTIHKLRSWQIAQREMYLKLGFNTFSKEQYIFTNKQNELYYPQVVNDWLKWIYQKAEKNELDLKRITPHGFRFTHCSLLFEAGASIKEVQSRLGHKDVQTTMNIYAQVTPQMIEDTGEKFANYIGF